MKTLKFIKVLEADKGTGIQGNDNSSGVDENSNNNTNNDSGNKDDSGSSSDDKGKTFTQAEVSAMMAKEKKQGKNSILKSLGFESEEDANNALKGYREYLDSKKSDKEKRAEAEKEQQKQLIEAQQKAEVAEAKVTAMKLGVKPKNVDDIITLALAKKTDDVELKDVIAELKKKYPDSFTDGSEEKGKKGTGGNISSRFTGGKSNNENQSLGTRLAAQRRATNKKSSFFK